MVTTKGDSAVTARQFARVLDVSPSYVTQLKDEGRLVFDADGKILVKASLAMIDQTADPSRPGTRQKRATGADGTKPLPPYRVGCEEPPESDLDAFQADSGEPIAIRRARALAEKAEAEARKALREEQIELGMLLRREDVLQAARLAAGELRNGLEALPVTLAPMLAAESDEARCRALLADAIERLLEQLSRQFAQIAREGAA